MNTYTIYNEHGEIVYFFVGTEDHVNLNIKDGLYYIEGEYSNNEYKIVDRQPVLKSQSEKLTPIDEVWSEFRNIRDIKLQVSDWTQVPDAPVDQAAWAIYRQELRDLPANTTDPRNVTWPEEPK
jgi:hypothetical protein